MLTSRSSPFLALAVAALLVAPAAALGQEEDEDLGAGPAPVAAPVDPFCPADEDADALDPADAPVEDPEPLPGDILDLDVADEPVDLSGVLDFCAAGATEGRLTLPVRSVASRRAVDAGTINLVAPGALVREVRLAPGRVAKALRPYRSVSLGSARRATAPEGFVELAVPLNAAGRKVVARSGRELRLTVRTTLRLASGASRTRTQAVLLRR